jgi:hypothetical protein
MAADLGDPLAGFSDLDYPGRKKPVNRDGTSKTKGQEASDTNDWDAKPAYYLVDGEKREFFTISHLAKALDYSVQSIRAWEAQGLLARTPYRSPRTKAPVAGGRSNKGKRLWTREQVEGIVRIAKEHRVIFPDRHGEKHPPTPAFAREVGLLFAGLTT